MPWNRRFGLALLSICLVSAALAQSRNPLVQKKKYLMGTVFEIAAYGESASQTSDAIEKAFQEISRLDDVMSDYKPESDLSRLNRSAHYHRQTVPSDLYRVIEESLRYSRLSDGRFDITVGPLARLWRSAERGEGVPSYREEEAARKCVGYRKIDLTPPDGVEFRSTCLEIDLGAIGKGYALDRAAEMLRANGITSALLDAGGSTIVALDPPAGEAGWTIPVRDPSGKLGPHVSLSNNSLSTSEQSRSSLLLKNSVGHILDPENGTPVKTRLGVSVIAKTGTESDALSTTMLLVGPEKGAEIVKGVAGAAAIWISSDGKSNVASSGPQFLVSSGKQVETR